MWILNVLPDAVIHTLLVFGIIGYGISEFLSIIPFIIQYKIIIRVISIIVLVIAVWCEGGLSEKTVYDQKISELQHTLDLLSIQSEKVNERVVTKYITKIKKIDTVKYVIKNRIQKAATVIDHQCVISPVVIDILNQASTGDIK